MSKQDNNEEKLRGNFLAVYLEFPQGKNNRFGAGGWSSKAREKPRPQLIYHYPKSVSIKGKSVFLDGMRKLKVNLVRLSTGKTMRWDYPDFDSVPSDAIVVRGLKKERHAKL